MDELFRLLESDPAVMALTENRKGLNCLTAAEEALIFAASFTGKPRNLVIIKDNQYTAQQLYNRLYPLLKDDVLLFSVEESLRVEAVAASPERYGSQMNVLSRLVLEEGPKIIVTHPLAIVHYLPSPDNFRRHVIELKVGQQYSMDQIRQILIEAGYHQSPRVDQPLTFAMRGGVIDVFSIFSSNPLRIEFFDDEIDSLRYFDVSSQRTVRKVEQEIIVPASTLIYDEDFLLIRNRVSKVLETAMAKSENPSMLKETVEFDLSYLENHIFEHYLYRYQCFYGDNSTFLDYVPSCQLIEAGTEGIADNLQINLKENTDYLSQLFEDFRGLNYYSVFADYDRLVEKRKPYRISNTFIAADGIKSDVRMNYFPLLPLDKAVEELIRLSENYQIHLSMSQGQLDILSGGFRAEGKVMEDYLTVMEDRLQEGFNYHQHMFLTAKEIFGVNLIKGRFENKFKAAEVLDSYQDLKPGDYVVHNQYGVGRYEGIVTRSVRNRIRDYLQIRYKDDDVLLVPLEQFKLVRKFVAGEGVGIKLNKIGSAAWNKTKERISKEVNDIAERLVRLYAAREENIGFAFSGDDDYSRKFERNIPYQLTDDQIRAIAEVKYDMEQPKPMDRLLCGDVGFGKTEVAMVAAFKACKDLKQVAYLCPTTILSAQHFKTFRQRFQGFPFKVALINRYVTDAEQKQILKQLKEGKIDILIGTHRLLSSDVKFADLGLLIIDEEQRFGVQAKEKIKELKKTIDVLSLSATPIPRTLQMSLVGVMSLSQLETPPLNRMPIQTYVVEKNDSLIRETIQRELARNGQVFYLHNNVSDIYETARKIRMLVPQASIGIGHGKMNRDEIEDVMYRFVQGEYNVLICTTIIETGIDIPNANTILIENAENFGLAQLYQIRGRVGRSDRVAFAYLMYRDNRQLSETATHRLQAIKEFTELGSGYKIAMRDLTIRGAGDLLGERQAGFINTIGMSLYLDMLNDAIRQQKGIAEPIIEQPKITVNDVDGYIPAQFVNQDYERISIYQKLDEIDSMEELQQYYQQQQDYYGKLPASINSLFLKKRIELMVNSEKIENYLQLPKENQIVLTEETSSNLDGISLFEKMNAISSEIKLKYMHKKITIMIAKTKNYLDRVIRVLEVIEEL